jgi:hypothetical protein
MSTQDPQHSPLDSRREFLRGSLRYLAAGGVLSGLGLLVVGQTTANSDDDCVNPFTCGRCSAFGTCDLPRALAARQRIGKYNPLG